MFLFFEPRVGSVPQRPEKQMDTISEETINAVPSDTPTPPALDFDDSLSPTVTPYINLVYFIIIFGLVIGVRIVYNTLNNRHRGRRNGSPFALSMNAGDELAYQALYGTAFNNTNGSDRVRQQQRTKVIQTAHEVVFDISPFGNHPRRRLTIMSKTQPALLTSFEPGHEHKDMTCALCLDPLDIRRIAAFPCNHPMHEDCFRNWVVKTTRLDCPMCAQDFSTYDQTNSSSSSSSREATVVDIRQ